MTSADKLARVRIPADGLAHSRLADPRHDPRDGARHTLWRMGCGCGARVYHVKASVLRGLAFAGVAAGSAAAAWASAGEALQVRLTDHSVLKEHDHRLAGSKACTMPDAFRSLASAPPGVMLNHFAFSAGVLVWTDHSVLSCPYHRNVTGTLTAINARRSSADRARAIVEGSLADLRPQQRWADQTLSAILGRGDHPNWIVPVDLSASSLSLYRVVR